MRLWVRSSYEAEKSKSKTVSRLASSVPGSPQFSWAFSHHTRHLKKMRCFYQSLTPFSRQPDSRGTKPIMLLQRTSRIFFCLANRNLQDRKRKSTSSAINNKHYCRKTIVARLTKENRAQQQQRTQSPASNRKKNEFFLQ